METYRKIVVPLDETEIGDRALDVALRFAAAFGSELILLRVHADPAPLEAGVAERRLDQIDREVAYLVARARLRALELGLRVGELHGEVRAGAVVAAIIDAVEEHMADLVIMGTHGRRGLTEMLAGSTTERLLARTTASVLAVKPPGFPYLRDEEPALAMVH